MSKQPALRVVPRSPPDFTDRAYWAGTIKMALSRSFVLQVLHDGPAHGYDIARAVERTTRGCCSPSEGALHPTLRGGAASTRSWPRARATTAAARARPSR